MVKVETFNEYQSFTEGKAVYNQNVEVLAANGVTVSMPWCYPAYALAEEAGEVVGKIAKFIRKSNQFVNIGGEAEDLGVAVAYELGDVLYQVSETARMFGYSLDEIVKMNVDKLSSRQERGVIVGEGDDR